MTLRPVGILGGMGPEATILLQRKLVAAVPATDDQDHIPLLIDMNPQVPSRVRHLLDGVGEDPGPTLAAMARRLEDAGALALAMPCNTAHHYAKAITDSVDIPLLNLIELAAEYAARTLGSGGCIGMLASPAVQRTYLFETTLQTRGLSVVWPADDEKMLAAIRKIKTDGPCNEGRETLRVASKELVAAGADLQLVACSEFSLIADSVAAEVNAIDTIDLLVQAIVEFSHAGQV
ncbi:aspartate/glutamate racemase family protein [Ruegeria faecimaris]|uniref:Aspartate racemase n=1 Tax=Ruegeria faecimaris TaxID=686389 RepID=A0A521F2V7_9RHOB|nr:amino acid racemase [Ruegeria faecimaris]SMO90503.1 aspartate racemase [Ruegeria faecimaris]